MASLAARRKTRIGSPRVALVIGRRVEGNLELVGIADGESVEQAKGGRGPMGIHNGYGFDEDDA